MAARRTPPYLVVLVVGSAITAIALGARSTMGIFLDPVSDGLGLGIVETYGDARWLS